MSDHIPTDFNLLDQSLIQGLSNLEIEDNTHLDFNLDYFNKIVEAAIGIQEQVYNSCVGNIIPPLQLEAVTTTQNSLWWNDKAAVGEKKLLLEKQQEKAAVDEQKLALKKQQETVALMRTIEEPNCRFFIASKVSLLEIKKSLDNGIWQLDPLAGENTVKAYQTGHPICLFFFLHERCFCGFGFFTEIMPDDEPNDLWEIPIKVHWLKQGLVPDWEVRERANRELPANGEEVSLQGAQFLRSFWHIRRLELSTICQ